MNEIAARTDDEDARKAADSKGGQTDPRAARHLESLSCKRNIHSFRTRRGHS
jgi:hypothetical protein